MTDRVWYVLPIVECRFRGEVVRIAVADLRVDVESDPVISAALTVDLDATLARRAAGAPEDPPEARRFDAALESTAKRFWAALRKFPMGFAVIVEGIRLELSPEEVRHGGWNLAPRHESPILTLDVDQALARHRSARVV